MINFPASFPNVGLLKKAVKWSLQNRDHIPSLSELAPHQSIDNLTKTGRAWQDAGLGTMIEMSDEGARSVHFCLNDNAVFTVIRLNNETIMGRIKSVNRSDWISIIALLVSAVALFKPD